MQTIREKAGKGVHPFTAAIQEIKKNVKKKTEHKKTSKHKPL